jgi:hypothetical protein
MAQFHRPSWRRGNRVAADSVGAAERQAADLIFLGVCKPGDRYLRGLFVAGTLAVIRYAKIDGTKSRPWLAALLTRRPTKVAAIALANRSPGWPAR